MYTNRRQDLLLLMATSKLIALKLIHNYYGIQQKSTANKNSHKLQQNCVHKKKNKEKNY